MHPSATNSLRRDVQPRLRQRSHWRYITGAVPGGGPGHPLWGGGWERLWFRGGRSRRRIPIRFEAQIGACGWVRCCGVLEVVVVCVLGFSKCLVVLRWKFGCFGFFEYLVGSLVVLRWKFGWFWLLVLFFCILMFCCVGWFFLFYYLCSYNCYWVFNAFEIFFDNFVLFKYFYKATMCLLSYVYFWINCAIIFPIIVVIIFISVEIFLDFQWSHKLLKKYTEDNKYNVSLWK